MTNRQRGDEIVGQAWAEARVQPMWRRALLTLAVVAGLVGTFDVPAYGQTPASSPPVIGSWLVAPADLSTMMALSPELPEEFFDNASTDFVGPLGGSLVPAGWSGTAVSQASAEGSLGSASDNDSCSGLTGYIPCLQVACSELLDDCDAPYATATSSWSDFPGLFFDDERWSSTPSLDQSPHGGVCDALAQAVADVDSANEENGTDFGLEEGPDANLAWPTLETWEIAESSEWQVDIRNDWPACAAGTNRYHIMSQSMESRWNNAQLGESQGSESDFDNYVTQTMLQANAAGISSSALTAGLGAASRYDATPQELYQDTLDSQAAFGDSPLVVGYWLNAPPGNSDLPVALQYLEMLNGTVPLYLEAASGAEQLTQTFPEGDAGAIETVPPGVNHPMTWVDTTDLLPVGTVIPAATVTTGSPPPDLRYRVQLFCADSARICQHAHLNITVGLCVVKSGNCTSKKTKLAQIARQSLLGAKQVGSGGDIALTPDSTSATTVTSKNEALYLTIQDTSATKPVDLYDYGDNCSQDCPRTPVDVPAAVAVPRPTTPDPSVWSTQAQASVLVPAAGGGLSVGLPANQGNGGSLDMATSGSTTYETSWTVSASQGPVDVPAGAALVQTTATDNNVDGGDSAVLGVQVGYCQPSGCTWPNENGTSVVVDPGTAIAASDGSSAFSMRGFTIPVGANLAVQLNVQTPGAVTLDLGGAEPTNIGTSFVGPTG
jgi:hypothetical protein